MKALNPKRKITTLENPYKVWIIDDFFPPEIPRAINQEWPELHDPRWFRGYEKVGDEKNLLEGGDKLAISKYEDMPLFTKKIMEFFHSKALTDHLTEITKVPNLAPDETLQWSGIRGMSSGSWQLIHSDARKNPINNKTKELTVLYYLNENYDRVRDEGCLELWNDTMTRCVEKVEPLFNRLVIFRCTDTSYHGVPLVKNDRRFLTFSVVSINEGTDRYRALFVPRPEDPDFIAEMGVNRSKIM